MANFIVNAFPGGFQHPLYTARAGEWKLWRDCYNAGWYFRDHYLEKFSTRETLSDFEQRRKLTPIATHAASAVNEIRDSIYQRLADVTRTGGSQAYQNAVAGRDMGVDMRGSTMNGFMGEDMLRELLVMGRVGVYVDAPYLDSSASLADAIGKRPYLYSYPIEDIISWAYCRPDQPSEFKALLLRDSSMEYDQTTMLPTKEVVRYRRVWIDDVTGLVNVQFLDCEGNPTDREGNPGIGPTQLQINRIPFVMPDVVDSLMRNICGHQIALLNIGSTDVNYALKANFVFYTEQKEGLPEHVRQGMGGNNTGTKGGQGASDKEVTVGVTQGRYYGRGMDRPGFISPPTEPLQASLQLQDKLEADIRKQVHLAVQAMASRASAESKSMDNAGLEAGLSYIGLKLENTELRIADFWSAYEDVNPARRSTATVFYPKRYSLKSDMDRIDEATKLATLNTKLISNTARKETQKLLAAALLGGKVSTETLKRVNKEIDDADYVVADPEVVIAAHQEGLVGGEVASLSLGYDKEQHTIAEQERVARAASIIAAQSEAGGKPASDPAARGVPDLSANPQASITEKTNPDGTKKRVRGKGKTL